MYAKNSVLELAKATKKRCRSITESFFFILHKRATSGHRRKRRQPLNQKRSQVQIPQCRVQFGYSKLGLNF
jgi:hypothetical protein